MLKKHPKKLIALVAIAATALYLFWAGFSINSPIPRFTEVQVESFGAKGTAKLNVIGIQARVETIDFASAAHLEIKLSSYLEVAREQGLLLANTIVLFPAHIGSGLLAVNQKSRIYNANSINAALTPIISHDLIEIAKNYFIFDAPDKILASTIRAKSKIAADTLNAVFSALAKKYKVTIIAGSGLLMTPGIYPDSLTYGHGPIFHTSFVFAPDGKPVVDAIRQIQPSEEEMSVAETSLAEFLPTFTTGEINYGVLIGADAERTDAIEYLAQQNVDLVLSPQFHQRNSTVGFAFGPDPRVKWAMAVSITGNGWGIEAQGFTSLIVNGEPISIQSDDQIAQIFNLWVSLK